MIFALLLALSIEGTVDAAAKTPPFDRAIFFVLVEDDDGTVVYERNSQLLAVPASVRKLFSAATVVECLGPYSQLETELWIDGDDVVIRGGGDPSFGSERYGYEPETTFTPFVRALRERGVRRVRDVIADVSMFDGVTIPYQWKVGNLTSDYAAPVEALAFRENEIRDSAVASPPLFAAAEFREALTRGGIAVEGSIRTNAMPRLWRQRVAVIRSPFIHQLLTTVLQNSHNMYAETLYKRAAAAADAPASYERARELETATLIEAGLEGSEFRFVDGSGLAPDDMITAAGVVKILRWMNAPERRGLYWDVLAQPAGDGTLRSRLVGLTDVMRGKTGTVAGVNSIAGILTNARGRSRYVVVIINHHIGTSGAATRILDSIVEAAASF